MNNNAPSYSINGIEKAINGTVGFIFYYRLVFVIASIIIISFISASVYHQSIEQERLKNLSVVVACGSVFIGIFYSVINYEHNQIKFAHDRLTSKITQSYTCASEWFKPSMVENLKITKLMFNKNKHLIDENKAIDFSRILDDDEPARSALVSIFNYLECVSIGIEKGILDDRFMSDYLAGVCIGYVMDYGFYIDYKRNTNKSPRIWINFTNMADRWKQPVAA